MSNVTNLTASAVTPDQVLDSVRESRPSHVYVVSVDQDGRFRVYGSGDLVFLADAAIVLTTMAMDVARGRLSNPSWP